MCCYNELSAVCLVVFLLMCSFFASSKVCFWFCRSRFDDVLVVKDPCEGLFQLGTELVFC
jgi:hypothetical protein